MIYIRKEEVTCSKARSTPAMLLFKGQATEHRTVRTHGLLVSKLKGIHFTCASHHSVVSQIGNFTDLCNICNLKERFRKQSKTKQRNVFVRGRLEKIILAMKTIQGDEHF